MVRQNVLRKLVVCGTAILTLPALAATARAQLLDIDLGQALGAVAESAVGDAFGRNRSARADRWVETGVRALGILADSGRGEVYHTPYCDGRGASSRQPCQPPTAGSTLERHFEQSRQALRSRSYVTALKYADAALKEAPENADAHQLRSLIFFAQGRYRESAGAAYQALARGPGWNWTTLWQLMGTKEHYQEAYEALMKAAENNPESVDFHFLLGYHHLMLGHLEAGRAELLIVQRLLPEDALNNNLLASLPRPQSVVSR